jgi:tRNA dimethylallyltransferase
MVRPRVVAIVGPTATGKSALAIALAHRFNGEVVSCDSTAVYRRFDIGTDKVPMAARQGVPHHLIDVADPTEEYSAARYAREAAAAIRDITGRGGLPILAGGTGLYYRALTRGFFPGPARDVATRARLERIADRKGVERLHTLLRRVDPASALRIHRRDRKRLVRALEVYVLTRRPLTVHFGETQPPLPEYDVVSFGLQIPPELTAARKAFWTKFGRSCRREFPKPHTRSRAWCIARPSSISMVCGTNPRPGSLSSGRTENTPGGS